MRPKPYTKDQILGAMKKTRSVRALARHLGCSYQHIKPYMKMYIDDESGLSLFDLHKNQCGRGVPKFLKGSKKEPALEKIFSGELDVSHFTPEKIKNRLIFDSYLAEECARCSMRERRVTDYKMPLLLNFKDGNKKHYILENLELLCYNCYFLYIADPFTEKEITLMEDFNAESMNGYNDMPTMELDDNMLQNLRDLGISID